MVKEQVTGGNKKAFLGLEEDTVLVGIRGCCCDCHCETSDDEAKIRFVVGNSDKDFFLQI